MSTNPRTNAGKRLDQAWPGSHLDRLDWQERIVAIEAEARADALSAVEEAVKAVPRWKTRPRGRERGYSEATLMALDEYKASVLAAISALQEPTPNEQ